MKRKAKQAAAALALLLALVLMSGCVQITAAPATPAPATPAPTPAPATAAPATEVPAKPTAVLVTPAPTDYPLTFTTPGNTAVQQFMALKLNDPLQSAADLFGKPVASYGENGYAYRAVAGGKDSEAAVVYRYMFNNVGLEVIASAADNRILKKQVSTPAAFPKLLDNAMQKLPQGIAANADFQQVVTALGVNPYLWTSFLLPNAHTDADSYDVCLWPDSTGQLVAVVQHDKVLRWEYQPVNTVLDAAAVDSATPRAPRWLDKDPKNGNDTLSKYAAFAKFGALIPGQSEADVTAKMGQPTSTDTGNASLKTLVYALDDGNFSGGKATFTFSFGTGADTSLIAKAVQALPVGTDEVRGRYAAQMLPGMTKAEIAGFMNGGALLTNLGLSTTGEQLQSFSYAGSRALVSAVFAKETDICLYSEQVLSDTKDEAATLYEEYVLPVIPSKPASPKKTPVKTRPPVVTSAPTPTLPPPVMATPTPKSTLPRITLRRPTFIIPIVTPTPVIIY